MNTPENAESLEVVPGQIVGGKWRIVGLIGRGGMGTVYEGQNISIGKKVALKFIDAEFARQPDIASRFQREAEAASLVESAHIVHIFDSGTTETGVPYIVMELLRGEDLRARLRRLGKLATPEAVHIVAQTLRGLHRAHEAGIVHRDLKPDNIFLVDRDDDRLFAKIVDFGISKMTRRSGEIGTGTLTRQGVVLGTPYYMSPEQAQALPSLDARTDLWSIGAILYECLAGRPPHLGDTYEQIIISICTTDPPDLRAINPGIPAPLAAVVHRALSRDKARRFQSARDMLDALQLTGMLHSLHGVTPPPLSSADDAASSGPAPPGGPQAGVEGAGARTRVSWTKAEPRAGIAVADTLIDTPEMRTSRARSMRRRGLLALGLAVTGAAFLLTFVFLRSQRSNHRMTAPLKPSIVASSANAPAIASTQPVDMVKVGETEEHPAEATEVVRAPTSRPAPIAPAAKPKKAPPPSPAVNAANASSPAPAVPASAAPAKTSGVAGGLQIKTTYP